MRLDLIKVVAVPPATEVTKKDGSKALKRSVVLELQEQATFPHRIVLETFKEDCVRKIGMMQPGMVLEAVEFDAQAREYNGKWYNSLNLWRIWESAEHSIPTQYPATPNPNDQPVLPPQTPAPQPPAAQAYATTAQQMAAPTAPSQPQQLPLTNEDCLPF